MQIGLKPDEVLDMSLDVFQACARGYADHIFDLQLVGVQQGYWAGYYSSAKKPKPLKYIMDKLFKARRKGEHDAQTVEKPDVDVDAFLAMEAQFNAKLQAKE
nr:MAG TPA: hypothetical protein [Caudoviricetes sp.]